MYNVLPKSGVVEKQYPECSHCSDPCNHRDIVIDDMHFCCEGCKMVYSILHENNLGHFYLLNENAGFTQKNKSKQTYSFLDDAETIEKLIDYQNEQFTKIRFYLPQIHCTSCLWLLEHIYKLNPHITHSRVDFLKKEASISFDHAQTTLRQVVELLDKIGYPPVINLNDLEDENKNFIDKTIYYQLGLAGFAFGNIMLFSFPEYLGLAKGGEERFGQIFGYLNLALILPVIFYSGKDYLRNAWFGLRQKHLNIDVPVSLGILALFSRSAYEILSHTGAGYLDSLAGLIFFLLIGKWFQQKTYSKISFDRDYKSYFPIAATVVIADQETQVSLDKLKKGDNLRIRHGELIPADSILMSDQALIDYSFVSGESDPVHRKEGDKLFAGGRQQGGLANIRVTKKVSNSYLTQLWNDHLHDKSTNIGHTSSLSNQVARFFTIIILIVAFATLFYWLPRDTSIAINAFTAVLIVACPCAVALAIPFTFGNVVRILAQHNIYFRNVYVLESLANVNHVVFDKTGTITDTSKSHLTYEGMPLNTDQRQWIKSLTHQSIHPVSQQISNHFETEIPLGVLDFREVKGKGIQGFVRGHFVQVGSHQFIQNTDTPLNNESRQNSLIAIDHKVLGSFKQTNKYRDGLRKVLQSIQLFAGASLLSGDNDREKPNLISLFKSADDLHFDKHPVQKLNFIKQLQSKNKRVAMIGDGLNDAGALGQSEVGIVLTENTSNFTPACDVIMEAKKFNKIPDIFLLAGRSIRIVHTLYGIALLYNIIGLSFAVRGALSPIIAAILMPLSSLSIVFIGITVSHFIMQKMGFKKE